METTREDLAYYAGLFDGEGSIGLYRVGRGYRRRVNISNTNRRVLEDICQSFRGAIYEYKESRPNHTTIHYWFAYGENAEIFLRQILPFLRIKKREAELFLQYQSKGKGRTHSDAERRMMDSLVEEIHMAKSTKKGSWPQFIFPSHVQNSDVQEREHQFQL